MLQTDHSTARAVDSLLMRNLYSFDEGNVIGKGMFYKKGHNVRNWKNRSWVINDFNNNRATPEMRDGRFRYFKPQEATGYDRDTSKDYVANLIGLNSDQKTIFLENVFFEKGDSKHIRECGAIRPETAYPLKVTFSNKDESFLNLGQQSKDTWVYELVFDFKESAEDFIRSLYQAAKRCPNLEEFIVKENLDRKSVLRSPRLTFFPHYQIALGCIKIAPNCAWPDCLGWGSYCACLCAELYTQGGLVFDMQTPVNQVGHLAAPIYAQCCVMESIVCQPRMIKECVCKMETMCCCLDLRFALPTDKSVPFEIKILGCKLCGQTPTDQVATELQPLKGGIPQQTELDKVKAFVGGNI